MTPLIDRLYELSTDGAAGLLAEREEAGARIVRRLVEDWASGANRFGRPGEALFGAWVDGALVGVCGLNVDPYAAGEGVGRVRHLYVRWQFRRQGIGRRLVARVIEAARASFDTLRLRAANPASVRLYEALGFRPAVGATDCTHVMAFRSSRGGSAASGRAGWRGAPSDRR